MAAAGTLAGGIGVTTGTVSGGVGFATGLVKGAAVGETLGGFSPGIVNVIGGAFAGNKVGNYVGSKLDEKKGEG